jgi:putative ABC transport system substrate-binding protein
MKRREVITLLGGAAAWPLAARAQQGDRMRRIGVLTFGPENSQPYQSQIAAFREGMAKLGWTEGRNLRTVSRSCDGEPGRLAAAFEELVNLRPEVILSIPGGFTAQAVQRRTPTIPIVFVGGGDPLDSHLVDSVARPTGNLTGFSNFPSSLAGKWVELFKEAVPRMARIAVLSPSEVSQALQAAIDAAAAQLAITVIKAPVRDPAEIERAIDAFAAEPNGGLLSVGPLPPPGNLAAIRWLALKHRLPMMRGAGRLVAEGVLMSHGPDIPDMARRASSYVDRLLRGAKVDELPIQYPTKFELVINLATANAIGLEISPTLRALADEVIE